MPRRTKKLFASKVTRRQSELYGLTGNLLYLLLPLRGGRKGPVKLLPIEDVTEEYLGHPSTVGDRKDARKKSSKKLPNKPRS
jgi:hypothetical protein